jgi:hypothetical protein
LVKADIHWEKIMDLNKSNALIEEMCAVRAGSSMPVIEILAKEAAIEFVYDFEGEVNALPEGISAPELYDLIDMSSEYPPVYNGETLDLRPYCKSLMETDVVDILNDSYTAIESALVKAAALGVISGRV